MVICPRYCPSTYGEHDIHYSPFNNFLKRHKCNPGLTGWAQVNGLRGANLNPDIMKRRMEFDLWYLNNLSFLDIYIIFKPSMHYLNIRRLSRSN